MRMDLPYLPPLILGSCTIILQGGWERRVVEILAPKLVGFHHLLYGVNLSLCQSQEFKSDIIEFRIDIRHTVYHARRQVQLGGIEQVHVRQVETNGKHTINRLWMLADDHRPQLA